MTRPIFTLRTGVPFSHPTIILSYVLHIFEDYTSLGPLISKISILSFLAWLLKSASLVAPAYAEMLATAAPTPNYHMDVVLGAIVLITMWALYVMMNPKVSKQ